MAGIYDGPFHHDCGFLLCGDECPKARRGPAVAVKVAALVEEWGSTDVDQLNPMQMWEALNAVLEEAS